MLYSHEIRSALSVTPFAGRQNGDHMNDNKRVIQIFWDVIWFLLFASTFIFIWWKCRYGFGNIDESFYLTIPFRLTQGDGLLVHEWHLSQLSGFLLYPIMQLYLMIAGSTEWIILTFRHIYVIVQAAATVFIYFRLRRLGQPGAVIASIAFMLYAPFGIMALSYNSMGIINLTISLVILLTSRKAPRLQYLIAGIFFAFAVLCCPYLIAEFVLWFLAVLIYTITRKGRQDKGAAASSKEVLLSFKCWGFFSIGAVIIAAVFAVFVISRGTLSEVFTSLPYILSDSEHPSSGVLNIIITYFSSILAINKKADLGYALLLVLSVLAVFDRKNTMRRAIYFICAAAITAVIIICLVYYGNYLNYVMFPVNIMAFFCALLCWKEPIRRVLLVIWLPGMLYSLCLHATSNQEFYAISSASTVALVGSVMIIFMCTASLIRELKSSLKLAITLIAALLLLLQLGCEGYLRYNAVFWDSMKALQSTVQSEGVEKGLYLSPPSADQYRDTLALKNYIDRNYASAESVAFYSPCTWMYLMNSDKRMASYSAWLTLLTDSNVLDAIIDKEMTYYSLYPDRIPDLIYLDRGWQGYMDRFLSLADYSTDQLTNGSVILYR